MKNSKRMMVMLVALIMTIAMATTTAFAWFATGTTATATGMTVKAQAYDSLSISNAAGGPFTATTVLSASLSSAEPCALKAAGTYTGATPFFKLTDTGKDSVNANDGRFNGEVSTAWSEAQHSADGSDDTKVFMNAAAGADYIKTSIWLKSSSVGTVTASYNFTAEKQEEISQAIHITLICNSVVFTTDTADVGTALTQLTATLYTFTAGNVEAGDAIQVDIYVWYDGNDSNCDNPAAISPENMGLVLTFTLIDGDHPEPTPEP